MSASTSFSARDFSKKLFELSQAVKESSLGDTLRDLVNIRASQLNVQLGFFAMHIKTERTPGELLASEFQK
jgi:hypothetical protein